MRSGAVNFIFRSSHLFSLDHIPYTAKRMFMSFSHASLHHQNKIPAPCAGAVPEVVSDVMKTFVVTCHASLYVVDGGGADAQ